MILMKYFFRYSIQFSLLQMDDACLGGEQSGTKRGRGTTFVDNCLNSYSPL